jgi:hypothetical protein
MKKTFIYVATSKAVVIYLRRQREAVITAPGTEAVITAPFGRNPREPSDSGSDQHKGVNPAPRQQWWGSGAKALVYL